MAHVKCPGCDRSINLTAKNEGKKVKCPCGTVLRMPARPAAEPSLSDLVNQSHGQVEGSSVPEYHKREVANRQRAARARERAEEKPRKKKQPEPDEDNAIPATAWAGILMIVGGAIGLFVGMAYGYIYYAPIAIIIGGLLVAVFGALFGDADIDDDF